jgi:hypothetical protein
MLQEFGCCFDSVWEIGGYFYIMVDDYTILYVFYSNFKKFIMDSYFSIDFFLKVSNV